MFRYRTLSSASLLVLCGTLSAVPSKTGAQTAGQALPPVTVEAPSQVRARPAVRKAAGEHIVGAPVDTTTRQRSQQHRADTGRGCDRQRRARTPSTKPRTDRSRRRSIEASSTTGPRFQSAMSCVTAPAYR